ncbi:MAG: ABC transporter permease [Candidatus Babeliales bacterium]
MSLTLRFVRIFGYFLLRDIYAFKNHWRRVFFNFSTILPLVSSLVFGYFLPNSTMINATPVESTIFFVGCILWSIFPLAFLMNLDLIFDLEHQRFIDYQIIMFNPILILLEKIIFSGLITFFNIVLFFPISKIILGSYFYTTNTSWPSLFLILMLGSLFCATFNIFMLCYIKSSQSIGRFWMRVNNPLITLGGLFMPWYIMAKYSYFLGNLALANPLIYLTEGVRASIIGGPHFFSVFTASLALIIFSTFFFILSCIFFKKKVDYV